MSFLRWLGKGTDRFSSARRPPVRRFRPALEILEDRLAPATLTVTTLAGDTSGGSLAYEIGQAKPGDIINFQAGLTGTILMNGVISLNQNITIDGPGESAITLSGNNGQNGIGFGITSGATVSISGLTITGSKTIPIGMDLGSIVSITDCAITNNQNSGVWIQGSTATLTDCTIANNSSTQDAGGIGVYPDSNAGGGGTLTMIGCTVSGNKSTVDAGGVGDWQYCTVTAINCTIANNQANNTSGGGGFLVDQGSLTAINCTIADNTTTGPGGGIVLDGSGFNGPYLGLFNSIVAANTEAAGGETGAKGDIDQVSASLSMGFSNDLVGNADGWIDIQGGQQNSITGTTAKPIDPKLGPLASNGGPTQTMALLAGSPAIDKGGNASAVDQNNNPLTDDQRGAGYPRIINNTVDIGAFEYTPIPPVVIAPTTLAIGVVGSSYSQTLTASGGTGSGFTFSESGTLPTGIIFNAGAFSGTPTQSGTFNITVTATDGNNDTGSQMYTLTVNAALSFGPAMVPAAVDNSPYAVTFTAAGGSGSGYTFSETGTLPPGIAFSGNQLTGKATVSSGTYSFAVTAKDSLGDTVTNNYSITVEGPILISPTALSIGTVNNAYSQTTGFSATGGSGSGYSFAESGTLPSGLTFNTSTAKLTGTPAQSGTFTFTLTATDGNGATGNQIYTLTIDPALTLSPAALPIGTVNNAYSQSVTPGGGSGSGYTFAESGTLPQGIGFNTATGAFSGIATQAGTFAVTITVTDSKGGTGSRTYTLTVDPALAINSSPNPLPYVAEYGTYATFFVASGGSGSGYTYSETGVLPAGIVFANGQLSGAATVASGTFNFTVAVTDSQGGAASQNFTLTAEGPITLSPGTLPIATLYNAYNQMTPLSASGGSGGGYTFAESGSLPIGLTFNPATSAFNGTPVQSGLFTVTIIATDSAGGTGSRSYTLKVDPALTLAPATLPTALVGKGYSQTLTAEGGSGTGYTFTASGTLPAGITFNAGTFAGTSTQAGNFPVTVTVTDSNNAATSRIYTVMVEPPLALTPETLPATGETDTYYVPLSASGGSGTGYTFAITSGAAPVGIGFSGNVLTGKVVSGPGAYTFTVAVTDSQGNAAQQSYTLNVGGPIVISSPATLPTGTLGTTYPSTAFLASGGSGAGYTYSETGSLPAGLTLNPGTGLLAGTPAQSGTFRFQVSATDNKGGAGMQAFTLVVNFSLGTSKNALFVDAVYQQLLGRKPDPGAVAWCNYLSNGGTPANVVASIERSTEYLGDVVTSIYEHYLGRPADTGAAGWVNALANGASIESVTASILSSAEYFADKGGSNAKFVQALYQEILGRAADSAGLNAWLAFLIGGGSRYQAALSFLTSKEYDTDLVEADYQQFLGRSADPTGLAGWVQALQSGMSDQAVLAAMFGSAEGYDKWA